MSESIGSDQAAQIRRSSATVLAGDADLGLRLTTLAVCPDCQRAQESRMLGSFVRFMKEAWAHATVILSGSTLRRLFRAHTRYPVGRVRHLVLGPFSFSEFLRALDKTHLAAEVPRRGRTAGGRPGVRLR